jgi:TRAP-type uncharacterized transport system fused permease subunit
LLLKIPHDGSIWNIIGITLKTGIGLAALAVAAQGWALHRTAMAERAIWMFAGLLLVFPSLIEALAETLTNYDFPSPAPFGLAIAGALLLKQKYWRVPAKVMSQ